MKELWEFCRKLGNPTRFGLLRKIYLLKGDGICVNDVCDGSPLQQAATSQYLKQLMELGLLRRERGGRLVAYSADSSEASPEIRAIACMLYDRFLSGEPVDGITQVFAVLGNAQRARMVGHIAKLGRLSTHELAKHYAKEVRIVKRDLAPAVKIGLLSEESDDADGAYVYVRPRDPILAMAVELLK